MLKESESVKQSPLRRRKGLVSKRPLYHRIPLRARTPLGRTKPIRQRSAKMEAIYEVRRELVEKILEERPWCERCLKARSQDCHEKLTRSRGGSIIDESNIVAICRNCHEWIHSHPREATAEGWLRRR